MLDRLVSKYAAEYVDGNISVGYAVKIYDFFEEIVAVLTILNDIQEPAKKIEKVSKNANFFAEAERRRADQAHRFFLPRHA